MVIPTSPFRLEREMLESILDALPHALPEFPPVNGAVVREPSVGRIIPDAVIGAWSCGEAASKLTSLTRIECHVVAILQRNGTVPELHVPALARLTPRSATRAVARLRKGGLLVDLPDGQVVLSSDLQKAELRVVAVEAKLRLWKRALEQASSYLNFADAAYVVLDGNQVRLTDAMLHQFRSLGIGLMLQHGPLMRVTLRATERPLPLSADRLWAVRRMPVGR